MPSSPAPRSPEPDRPDAETPPPRRKFRHLKPIDDDTQEVVERGHGSGCIPIILIRLSFLALLVYLVCLAAGMIAARQINHAAAPAPHAQSHP
jgi:hypothetical protein